VSKDVTFDNGPAAYWSSIEVNVGIICASLPTLKAFVSRFFPKFFGGSSRNNGQPSTTTRRHTTGLTSRKQGGTIVGNGTVTEVELSDSKAWADTARLDPGRIQVVTLIEQEREELREEDRESDSGSESDGGRPRHGMPSVVVTAGGGAWAADDKSLISKGHDMA